MWIDLRGRRDGSQRAEWHRAHAPSHPRRASAAPRPISSALRYRRPGRAVIDAVIHAEMRSARRSAAICKYRNHKQSRSPRADSNMGPGAPRGRPRGDAK